MCLWLIYIEGYFNHLCRLSDNESSSLDIGNLARNAYSFLKKQIGKFKKNIYLTHVWFGECN